VENRRGSTKTGDAIKKKYYLLFTTSANVGPREISLFCLSLPFMVSVHGTQDNTLWPAIFWDTAFSEVPVSQSPLTLRQHTHTRPPHPSSQLIDAGVAASRPRLQHRWAP
jgi:hypothetical protein